MAHQSQLPVPAFALGDAHDIAKLVADVVEADDPKTRYVIGQDAEYWLALDSDQFEQTVRPSLGSQTRPEG